MAYPFIHANVDIGVARGPRLAITWHMAEGGGTVGYLSKANPNGVAVHFVIEYDGDIIQMLQLSHAQASINPRDIRTTNDQPYTFNGDVIQYGREAAQAALGKWADTKDSLGPNHATIGVEVEGFASKGPNAAQRAAIEELHDYLKGIYPSIVSLGHRDFADYKACPGKLFPWDRVGGHFPGLPDTSTEEEVMGTQFRIVNRKLGSVRTKVAIGVIPTEGGPFTSLAAGSEKNVYGDAEITDGKYAGQPAWLVQNPNGDPVSMGLLLKSACTELVPVATPVDTSDLDARRAEWDRIKAAATVALPPRP